MWRGEGERGLIDHILKIAKSGDMGATGEDVQRFNKCSTQIGREGTQPSRVVQTGKEHMLRQVVIMLHV